MKAIFVGGKLNGKMMDVEEVKKNYWNGELSEDCSELRAKGILCHRAELDNQPMVDGYLSPMWDGDKLRYETFAVYDMLSR